MALPSARTGQEMQCMGVIPARHSVLKCMSLPGWRGLMAAPQQCPCGLAPRG